MANISTQILQRFSTSVSDEREEWFLPEHLFDELVTEDAIANELASDKSEHQTSNERRDLITFIARFAKKLFLIFVHDGLERDQLLRAMEFCHRSGLTDNVLPFNPLPTGGHLVSGDDVPLPPPFNYAMTLDDRDLWNPARIFRLHSIQWRFLAPVFSTGHTNVEVSSASILPFTWKSSKMQTGRFGDVHHVQIHPSHLKQPSFDDNGEPALMVMKTIKDTEADTVKETEHITIGAQNVKAKEGEMSRYLVHNSVAQPIATFLRGKQQYLIFPWADGGNLRDFWSKHPQPTLRPDLIKQSITQLHGLASALKALHDNGGSSYRHGDLKPENILRFKFGGSDTQLGHLKIADLGLTQLHSAVSRSRQYSTDARPSTIRYEPPEAGFHHKAGYRSRLYDVWSLGCIMLEFIGWLLHGIEGAQQINNLVRGANSKDSGSLEVEDTSGILVAIAHPNITRYMDLLAIHPACQKNTALGDLLGVVRRQLLVVELPQWGDEVSDPLVIGNDKRANPSENEIARSMASASTLEIEMRRILSKIIAEYRTYLVTERSVEVLRTIKAIALKGVDPKTANKLLGSDLRAIITETHSTFGIGQNVSMSQRPSIKPTASLAKDIRLLNQIGLHAVSTEEYPSATDMEETSSKFVDYISRRLLVAVGGTLWVNAASIRRRPDYYGFVGKHCEEFLRQLTETPDTGLTPKPKGRHIGPIQSLVFLFIRRHIPQISRQIAKMFQRVRLDLEGDSLALEELLFRDDLLPCLVRQRMLEGDDDANKITMFNLKDNDTNLELAINLRQIIDTMFPGPAFSDLCLNLRSDHHMIWDSSKMMQISDTVLGVLERIPPNLCTKCWNPTPASLAHGLDSPCFDHPPRYEISIKTDWKPIEYLQSQFGDDWPSIKNVLIYAGCGSDACASTCWEYSKRTWPSSATKFLQAVEMCVYNKPGIPSSEGFEINAKLSDERELEFTAYGTRDVLVEVSQQASWISSALRLPSQHDNAESLHQFCVSNFEGPDIDTLEPRFEVSCQFKDIPSEYRSCWMNLIGAGAVISEDFPIPFRHKEKGLEIALNTLAQIAGVQHAVVYEGGVVLKGPTAMLIPLSRDRDIIQWHLVISKNRRRRLTYAEGVSQCIHRALTDQVDLEALKDTRAVVGWWPEAHSRLGGEDVNYENIHYSTAKEYEPLIRLSKRLALGAQQFATGQVQVAFGLKDSAYQAKRVDEAYEDIVYAAEQMRVLLYDTSEKRAWLANGAEVILHIIRKRGVSRPFVVDGQRVSIPSENSVTETFRQHGNLTLVGDKRYPQTLEMMVVRYFGLLDDLFVVDLEVKRRPEMNASIPFEECLVGHEFMSLIDRGAPIGHLKKCVLAKTGGGWPRLIRDSDALTLFGSGFEDLIQPPTAAQGLCHRWRTMPKQKDYLGIRVELLLDLYEKAGCLLNKEYLTPSQLCWHRGTNLFEACGAPGSFDCRCDRVQDIMPSASVGTITPPGKLNVKGAVIFGRSSHARKQHVCVPSAPIQDPMSLYAQPNVSLEAAGYRRQ